MATVIGASVKWGTSKTKTYGEIQSLSIEDGAQTKEIKDNLGEVVALAKWDQHKAINLTAIMLTTSTKPTIHDVIEIADGTETIKARVTSVSEAQQNEGETTLTIAARTYPKIGDEAKAIEVVNPASGS